MVVWIDYGSCKPLMPGTSSTGSGTMVLSGNTFSLLAVLGLLIPREPGCTTRQSSHYVRAVPNPNAGGTHHVVGVGHTDAVFCPPNHERSRCCCFKTGEVERAETGAVPTSRLFNDKECSESCLYLALEKLRSFSGCRLRSSGNVSPAKLVVDADMGTTCISGMRRGSPPITRHATIEKGKRKVFVPGHFVSLQEVFNTPTYAW